MTGTIGGMSYNCKIVTPARPAIPAVPDTRTIGGAELDFRFMHGAVKILLSVLSKICESQEALAAWDEAWLKLHDDLDKLCEPVSKDKDADGVRNIVKYDESYLERYKAMADMILLKAGIAPKGRNLSSGSCWVKQDAAFYWKPSNSYLPAYNNVVYHSAKRNADGEVYSTKEFAFTIVCACPQYLKAGDQVTVNIETSGSQTTTYQLGDKFSIPVVAGKQLQLSGGVDGNDTLTWKVEGSKAGRLPDYKIIAREKEMYKQNGLQFLIEKGGVPFALGDQWTFAVGGGKFRWKKDDDAWSEKLDIASRVLADNLSVVFSDGPAPSFKVGDTFEFKALQPNSADHVKKPTMSHWMWVGSSATLTVDCGGKVQASDFFVADHNIPEAATVVIEGSNDGFLSVDWSEQMSWNSAVLAKVFPNPVSVTHLRLTISAAPDCYIGWFCAGVGLTTDLAPSLTLSRKYASITGNSKIAGGAVPLGAGWGGRMSWENSLSHDELSLIITLLDYLKANDNEPVILVPHIMHEEEAMLCRVDTESVEITDVFDYQPDALQHRVQSLVLPLEPVYL